MFSNSLVYLVGVAFPLSVYSLPSVLDLPIIEKSGSISDLIGLLDISNDPNDVDFYLYPDAKYEYFTDYQQRLIYSDPESIKNSNFNPSNPVILLIHGFTQTYRSQFPYYVRNAYLDAGYSSKANIIAVDWGKLSGRYDTSGITGGIVALTPSYLKARSNVNIVGKRVQEFLTFLIQNGFLFGPDQVHIIGQSLGAHVSGMAGFYFRNETSTLLGRITGTDPAAPLFQYYSTDDRLDESDAKFVDIVHTNQGQLGYVGSLGHVDFYINGGGPTPQPECMTLANITDAFCSHNLAPRYYAKSIADPTIKGYSNTLPILSYYLFGSSETFGEHCPPSARGSYYVSMTL